MLATVRLAELTFAGVPVGRVVVREIAHDMPKRETTRYYSTENAVRSFARTVYDHIEFCNSA